MPMSHSTITVWIHDMFDYFEPEIREEIKRAKSRITITFDGWGSKHEKISVIGVVVHFINEHYECVTRLIGLPELPKHGKAGIDQAAVILFLLTRFGITAENIGYFVLDNASNNDTTLVALSEALDFDPIERRLRCMGHILNLIAESYLFGQDASSFDEDFKKAGPAARRKLWRQRGELGKLHNLVTHIMASGKRIDIFKALQSILNDGIAAGKIWKVVLDGGIRWNSFYAMIRRALELKDALDAYCFKFRFSTDDEDKELFEKDYLSQDEWKTLEVIKEQLEPLFYITKGLEGNANIDEDAGKASHGALWEQLPLLEHVLTHFEGLEKQAKAGKFNKHRGIQSSITLAWQKTQVYYEKTDASIAWMASLVLYSRWKWAYFDKNWAGQKKFVDDRKKAFKKLWETRYKTNINPANRLPSKSPEPPQLSYIENIFNNVAPIAKNRVSRLNARRDQLWLYLNEDTQDDISYKDYWKEKETQWPELTRMAWDFMAILAMSSECERVFSSCAKLTTPESSRLSGEMLWH